MTTSGQQGKTAVEILNYIGQLDSDFLSVQQAASKILTTQPNKIVEDASVRQLCEQTIGIAKQLKEAAALEKVKISQQLAAPVVAVPAINTFEISNSIRLQLQKSTSNFEQSFNDSTNSFYKPVIGTVWADIHQWLDDLDASCLFEKPKMETIQVTLTPETTVAFQQLLKNQFSNFTKDCTNNLQSALHAVTASVTKCLEDAGVIGFSFVPAGQNVLLENMSVINSCVRIDNVYEGSFPKKNIKNLIFEMRSLMMMFLLIVSTLGINKSPSEIIKNGVFIASIALLVIGVLYTIANNTDQKDEKTEEELKKAKDRLLAEAKRAVNEFVSEWRTRVTTAFRNELTDMGFEADNFLNKYTKKNAGLQNEERLRLTKSIQELELKEKICEDVLKQSAQWIIQSSNISD